MGRCPACKKRFAILPGGGAGIKQAGGAGASIRVTDRKKEVKARKKRRNNKRKG
jgi:hypothetical protein